MTKKIEFVGEVAPRAISDAAVADLRDRLKDDTLDDNTRAILGRLLEFAEMDGERQANIIMSCCSAVMRTMEVMGIPGPLALSILLTTFSIILRDSVTGQDASVALTPEHAVETMEGHFKQTLEAFQKAMAMIEKQGSTVQ